MASNWRSVISFSYSTGKNLHHSIIELSPPHRRLCPPNTAAAWCCHLYPCDAKRHDLNIALNTGSWASSSVSLVCWSTTHPRHSRGLRSWKRPRTVKQRLANLRPYGKPKTQNTIILIINNMTTFVLAFIGMMSAFRGESCLGDRTTQSARRRGRRDLVKKEVTFGCFAFFCISL